MTAKSPIFSYVLLYLAGIVFGNNLVITSAHLFLATLIVLFVSLVMYYLNCLKNSYTINTILRVSILMTFFIAGVWNISYSPNGKKNLFSTITAGETSESFHMTVKQRAKVSSRTSNMIVYSRSYNESIILYSYDKKAFDQLVPGDEFEIKLNTKKISTDKEFGSYNKYLNSLRCFNYGFVRASDIHIIKSSKKGIINQISVKRKTLLDNLRKMYGGNEWCDIFIAITSGEKYFLDGNTKKVFKSSGALHLMAVSGLHIGFVYIIILKLLFVLGGRDPMRVLKSTLTLILIWSYCAFSGFSASSLRASIMISFMVVSWFVSGRYLSLNALCCSALLISLFQPSSVFSTGFQLSYCAMLSIIFVNPYFSGINSGNNKIINYFRDIITISVSCQLGTSIITISTFGIFPTYFLLSNIALVPLTALIIMLSSIIVLTGFQGFVVGYVMKSIRFIIELMLYIAQKIDSLPSALIKLEKDSVAELITVAALSAIIIYMVYKGSRNKK